MQDILFFKIFHVMPYLRKFLTERFKKINYCPNNHFYLFSTINSPVCIRSYKKCNEDDNGNDDGNDNEQQQ